MCRVVHLHFAAPPLPISHARAREFIQCSFPFFLYATPLSNVPPCYRPPCSPFLFLSLYNHPSHFNSIHVSSFPLFFCLSPLAKPFVSPIQFVLLHTPPLCLSVSYFYLPLFCSLPVSVPTYLRPDCSLLSFQPHTRSCIMISFSFQRSMDPLFSASSQNKNAGSACLLRTCLAFWGVGRSRTRSVY